MNRSILTILGLPAVLLAGCVTGGPAGSGSATSARVQGHVAEPLGYFTRGEPNLVITAIDGQRTPLFTTNLPVAPGRHFLTINVAAFPIANTTTTVAFEFQAGKQYGLTAQKADGAYQLVLWDESAGAEKRTLLTTSRIGRYVNAMTTESAVLRGSQADAFGPDPWSQSQVQIAAIDSQTVKPAFWHSSDLRVVAGKRLVTLNLFGSSGTYASPTIEMEFKAGKTYRLTACEVDQGFDLMSWVELPGIDTRALVMTTRVQGRHDDTNAWLLLLLLSRK